MCFYNFFVDLQTVKYVGAYITDQPTLAIVPQAARALGCTAFGILTAPTNVWRYPDPDEETCRLFREGCERYGYGPAQILPHAGFVINLCSPDKRKLAMSRQALIGEMRRCRLLGLTMVNFHPGSTLGQMDDDAACRLVAESLNYVLDKSEGVKAVIENTAGQGSTLGRTFAQIAAMIDGVEDKSRVGVCVDTAHAHAAGIDFVTAGGYESSWAEFDRTIGREYLSGMHLNDSKKPLGSHIDRHESIGKGTVGAEVFARLMRDPRTDGIPMLLETPDESLWPEEIKTLDGYSVRQGEAG